MTDETDEELIGAIEFTLRVKPNAGLLPDTWVRILALARRGAATKWRPIEEYKTGKLEPLNAIVCNQYGGKVMAQSDKWGDWYIKNDCGDTLYTFDSFDDTHLAEPLQPHFYIPTEALGEPGK
jgi:hypothetical protein